MIPVPQDIGVSARICGGEIMYEYGRGHVVSE